MIALIRYLRMAVLLECGWILNHQIRWQQYLNLSEDKEEKAPSSSSSDRVRAPVQQPPSQEAFRELLQHLQQELIVRALGDRENH